MNASHAFLKFYILQYTWLSPATLYDICIISYTLSFILVVENKIKNDSELKNKHYWPNLIHSVCLCKYNAYFVTVVPSYIKFLKSYPL
jgi:hypothetical protein